VLVGFQESLQRLGRVRERNRCNVDMLIGHKHFTNTLFLLLLSSHGKLDRCSNWSGLGTLPASVTVHLGIDYKDIDIVRLKCLDRINKKRVETRVLVREEWTRTERLHRLFQVKLTST
jgi:hypothetical protein